MLEEFLNLFLQSADRFVLAEGELREVRSSEKRHPEGAESHEVLSLKWTDGNGYTRVTVLREADITHGGYNPETQTFEFFDTRRMPVSIQLSRGGEVLSPADTAARPAKHAFALTMVEEFRRVWQLAGLGEKFIVIGEEALAVDSYELAAPTGMPGNYLLVARSRDADGAKRVVVVTEAGVEAGRFNPERQVFEFLDRGNQPAAIQLRSGGAVVVPEILCSPQAKKPETVFAVVQEGGSSTELYVHQFDQAEDAQQYRVDSWKDGAYRTSPVVEVPLSLADHPEFNTVVENLLKAALEVDGVEGKG